MGYLGRRLFALPFFLLIAGCGATIQPIEPIATKQISFQCDPMINGGDPLQIDVVYVTYVRELRELSSIGPQAWFSGETKHRKQWKFKESVVLKPGIAATVKLDPLVLRRTVLLVVYANYKGVRDPSKMQIVVDFAGKKSEIIEVKQTGLMAKNKDLNYTR